MKDGLLVRGVICKWFLYYGGWCHFRALPKGVAPYNTETQKCPTDPERADYMGGGSYNTRVLGFVNKVTRRTFLVGGKNLHFHLMI